MNWGDKEKLHGRNPSGNPIALFPPNPHQRLRSQEAGSTGRPASRISK
jgi:hypothetical protein